MSLLNDPITSEKTINRLKSNVTYDYVTSQPYNMGYGYKQDDYEYVKETYQHGTLLSILPKELSEYIVHSNKEIVPILDEFYDVTGITEIYTQNIVHLRDSFKEVIEKSIYRSMDLHSIIDAQNLIAIIVDRVSAEINDVEKQIQSQFKGKSMQGYQIQLRDLKKLLEYFNQMIDDCFGTM